MSFSEGAFPEEVDETAAPDAGTPAGPEGAAEDANGSTAGSGPAAGPASAVEADPVEVVARGRDEYLMALQRTQADFENYRKRIARLQDVQSARAAADLVSKLLPVLDTLDLAEAHLNESLDVSEDGKALRASRAMLMDILGKEGLERLDRAEVPFDPSVHDAVAHTDGEGGETMVEEVFRSGYRWKGQVLRPAMVRVRG
jgi:molecular chaperone GrpE